LGVSKAVLDGVVADAAGLAGAAGAQVDAFAKVVAGWVARVPESASIRPGRIL
jgi:hypothetical protein